MHSPLLNGSPILTYHSARGDTHTKLMPRFWEWSVAYFYLTGHSPVFVYNTTLLYKILLTLCGHFLRPSVFAVCCIQCRGRMGSWWLRSPVGSNTLLCPRLPQPNQSAGCAAPKFRLEGRGSGSIRR